MACCWSDLLDGRGRAEQVCREYWAVGRRSAAYWLHWQSGPAARTSRSRRVFAAEEGMLRPPEQSALRIRLASVAWSAPECGAWWTVLRVDCSVIVELLRAIPDNQRAI